MVGGGISLTARTELVILRVSDSSSDCIKIILSEHIISFAPHISNNFSCPFFFLPITILFFLL